MGVTLVDASVEVEAKSISLILVTLPHRPTLMLASAACRSSSCAPPAADERPPEDAHMSKG